MTRPMKLPTKETHPHLTDAMFRSYTYNGKEYSYGAAHHWIHHYHGKAIKCESLECTGKSKNYQWSNISHEYKKVRSDWQQLCSSCHGKYDQTEKNRESVGQRSYGNSFHNIPINQYTSDGTFIKQWKSMTEAAKAVGTKMKLISAAVNGDQHTAGGFKWKRASALTNKVS